MKRGKNLVIDFWRLIFSLIIMLYHTVYFKEYYGYFPIFRNGYIGVEFFCIVSGFLMVKSSYKIDLHSALTGKETIRFLLRKIRSILSYWFFVSLLCLGIRLLEVKNIYMAIEQIAFSIWNFLFLQKSGLAPFALINVGWYVSSMLMCMLILYPLCIRNRDIFINILCPAVSICIYSFFSLRYKHIAIGTDWYGCINSGTLRVCGGLCLGGGGYMH
ncbi:MAG: hypothetical protein HFE84_12515 [Lachnospiraceae bacterium]|nr:hypothetical protein [Lachnospiraceae bacterium]